MADLNITDESLLEGLESEVQFVPRPGQIDFTNIKYAPVVNCLVVCNGKILLVQRNQKMRYYPGYWNGLSGFLHDNMTVDEKARYELEDEAKIKKDDILKVTEGEVFEQIEKTYQKVWVVHPIRVDVKSERVTLDWEAQDHQWISPSDVLLYKTLTGFEKVVYNFFPKTA